MLPRKAIADIAVHLAFIRRWNVSSGKELLQESGHVLLYLFVQLTNISSVQKWRCLQVFNFQPRS